MSSAIQFSSGGRFGEIRPFNKRKGSHATSLALGFVTVDDPLEAPQLAGAMTWSLVKIS